MNDSSGICVCGVNDYHAVKCDQSVEKVYILDSYQMTYDDHHQEVVAGLSIYGISAPNDIYHEVPMNISELNEAMCGQYNRKGRLCGECKEGYNPLVYSYEKYCRKCSEEENTQNYIILKLVVVTLTPLTALYLVVVLFKFNANSPKLHGFILYAQIKSAPFHV